MLSILVAALALGGCVPTPMYNWKDYSSTLYHYRKDANETTKDRHMAELEAIVQASKENNLRVPPGVYCELGYMYAKKGNKNKALELFDLEKTTYPESTHFINRLVQSISSAEESGKKL